MDDANAVAFYKRLRSLLHVSRRDVLLLLTVATLRHALLPVCRRSRCTC
jgi:hypothetical protein